MRITLSTVEINLDPATVVAYVIVVWNLIQSRMDRKKATLK